jgi:hypothetical protein
MRGAVDRTQPSAILSVAAVEAEHPHLGVTPVDPAQG